VSFLVFVICALVIRRRYGRVPIVVPAITGSLAAATALYFLGAFFSSGLALGETLKGVSPSDKATIYAAVISELLNTFAFDFVVWLFLGAAALRIDRLVSFRRGTG
jgi:hypothetical protein